MSTLITPAWKELVRIEPRLEELLTQARVVDTSAPGFDEIDFWYRTIKPQLIYLVGWMARGTDSRLHTPRAYDVAVGTLYDAMREKAA